MPRWSISVSTRCWRLTCVSGCAKPQATPSRWLRCSVASPAASWSARSTTQKRWNPRVTDTTDIRDVGEQRLELLRRKLAERGLRTHDDIVSVAPVLSDAQRRMWFVQSADTTGALLNVCVSYRITGDVDLTRLRNAVNAVARAHAVLRTTYAADADGEPQLTVHDDLAPRWTEHELSELSEHARQLRL